MRRLCIALILALLTTPVGGATIGFDDELPWVQTTTGWQKVRGEERCDISLNGRDVRLTRIFYGLTIIDVTYELRPDGVSLTDMADNEGFGRVQQFVRGWCGEPAQLFNE